MTETIYKAQLMPVWMKNGADEQLFTDKDAAVEFIEEFAYEEHGLQPSEWTELGRKDGAWKMLFENGEGNERALVTEITLYEDVSEMES